MRKPMPMSELEPLIRATVEQGGEFPLVTAGTSMLPMLRDREDTVWLKKKPERLKKYDLPLYKRADGTYVLHRVVAVGKDGYAMCGDNQYRREYPVNDGQILAVVGRFEKNGKITAVTSWRYRLYCVRQCVIVQNFRRLKAAVRRVWK